MSIWISFEPGIANVYSGRQELQSASPKAVPTARMTSASRVVSFAARVPQMPVVPTDNGSVSGNRPLPIKVVATGACSARASSASSPSRRTSVTPLPAKITGRSALDEQGRCCGHALGVAGRAA